MGSVIFDGVLQIAVVVQMFMLGPRFILSVREHYAKLETNPDEGIIMTSIAFEERILISTGSTSQGE
jgi:hypothetical protein